MENNRYMKYMRRGVAALNGFLLFYMAYVVTKSAGYTVLLGDDYTHGVRVGVFHVPLLEYIGASLGYMKEIYLDWQGTYFAMFLQALLSPVNNFGMPQLKAVMMGNALLFILALLGALRATFAFVMPEKKERHLRLLVCSLVLFAILDAEVFTEIFFWYSGAVAYSIPFSCGIFSCMFLIMLNNERYSKRRRTVYTVCAAVLSFLASGGSLAVSGTGCYALLLLTVGLFLYSGKLSLHNMAVTAAGIVGALINVAAPGNFARHTYNSGGDSNAWRLVQSVKDAIKIVWGETERLTKETFFGILFLAMLLVGIYLGKRLAKGLKAYGVVSILALGAGFVTAFPVVFGYGGSEFPNRCYFILDVTLLVCFLNFAVFLGACLDRWGGLSGNKSACAVLAVVFLAAALLSPVTLSDSAFTAMAKSQHSGAYGNYYAECIRMYDVLALSGEEDVIVDVPEYIPYFECFYLDEDAAGWVNVGMAEYYHKNSVRKRAE